MSSLTFRRGSPDDAYTTFEIFEESLSDLLRRLGHEEPTSYADPLAMARMWQERRPLYEHIVSTAEEYWLAETEGVPVGFARSVTRGDVLQLTELFVRPGLQSAGAGKGLLSRTFAPTPDRRRLVIASPDVRAQVLYMRSGVYPLCSVYYFYRAPRARSLSSELEAIPVQEAPDTLRILNEIDRAILSVERPVDHHYLLNDRQGYLFLRRGRTVGYGYCGKRSGPFALLEPQDIPAALAFAENEAATRGESHFGVEVPLLNRAAIQHLLGSGFLVEPFFAQLLTDAPVGQFDRYIITSPPFLL